MESEKTFKCDLGGEKHNDHKSVRGSVGIYGADISVVFDDICDKHIDELVTVIKEQFGSARPRIRDERAIRKAASAEDNAMENAREAGILN